MRPSPLKVLSHRQRLLEAHAFLPELEAFAKAEARRMATAALPAVLAFDVPFALGGLPGVARSILFSSL